MSSSAGPSRRERLRAQALAEIREHADAQIAAGGPGALSLNGIAKAMGMSGPALYRYFASRDDLLATLVTESYEELGDTIGDAAERTRSRPPEERLRAVLNAYRDWALAHPHRYRLMYSSTYGSGALDPERIVPAAQRPMDQMLAILADLGPAPTDPALGDDTLRRQLIAWGSSRSGVSAAPGVLHLGVLTWTRMHGLVSLEIEGIFAQMGVDPARLYRAELERLIAQRTGGAVNRC